MCDLSFLNLYSIAGVVALLERSHRWCDSGVSPWVALKSEVVFTQCNGIRRPLPPHQPAFCYVIPRKCIYMHQGTALQHHLAAVCEDVSECGVCTG